jgi:hypothetical protein
LSNAPPGFRFHEIGVGRRYFATALNHSAPPADQRGWLMEGRAVVKRFLLSSVVFIGLIVPGAILIALLVAR